MEKTAVRKSLKTKGKLKTALIELLKTKDINHITVKELVEKVDISRSTFYAHYDDIYSVLQEIEDDVIAEISEVIQHDFESSLQMSPFIVTYSSITYINENIELFKYLIGSSGSATFTEKLKKQLSLQIMRFIKSTLPGNDEDSCKLMSDFVASGALGIAKSHLKNVEHIDLEKSNQDLNKMLKAILTSIVKML